MFSFFPKKLLSSLRNFAFLLLFYFAPIDAIESNDYSQPFICLSVIINKDSKEILNCLNNVKAIVDCISIFDEGAPNETRQLVEKFMLNNQIPGDIHDHRDKNNSSNKTHSLICARETLSKFGFPLDKTYFLLMDADLLFVNEHEFRKADMSADAYQILQKTPSHSHYYIRFIRASLPFVCLSEAYDYWQCKIPPIEKNLKNVWVESKTDKQLDKEKAKRDIPQLIEALNSDPENEKTIFYLAQCYQLLEEYTESIRWYQARIKKGGDEEEIWYSKLMSGDALEKMGYWDQALTFYFQAFEQCPQRAEPLFKIAQHYRIEGQTDLAYFFANEGSKIPYPKDTHFFIADPIYKYLFDEELSISAYYTPFREHGFDAANRLILYKNLPSYLKDQTYRNIKFYLTPLKNAEIQPLNIDLPLLQQGFFDRYEAMNASILKKTDGYFFICRVVNYDRKLNFKSRDPLDPAIRSRNYFVDFDNDFHARSQKEIIEDFPRRFPNHWYKGLEDCRMFVMDEKIWFTAATFGTHTENIVGQVLCQLDEDLTTKQINVHSFLPLNGPNPKRHEKNWLPFVIEDELYLFYMYDPLTIYKVDKETGDLQLSLKREIPIDFTQFRGSSPPIKYQEGYLMLVHEVIYNAQTFYMHRFVFLDKDLHIKKISKPFSFKQTEIEYCLGMVIDHQEEYCILPFSIDDKEAWICKVPLDTIDSLLEQLPSHQ